MSIQDKKHQSIFLDPPWVLMLFLFLLLLLFLMVFPAGSLLAQHTALLQGGIVKITAKPAEGVRRVGTGFIVKLENDVAYIITAAHVVAGDPRPEAEFFTRRNIAVPAKVLGTEGNDDIGGLALLMVEGKPLPQRIGALPLAAAGLMSGGEHIVIVTFPRHAGPWNVTRGSIGSRTESDLYFSPDVDEGRLGGPIIQNGRVVGLVSARGQSIGRGVTAGRIEDYLEGFHIITLPEGTASNAAESRSHQMLPRQRHVRAGQAVKSPARMARRWS
jgi:S1-C subfamily serine protease